MTKCVTRIKYFEGRERRFFRDQHLDRIDNIELALKEMWLNYRLEKDTFRKVLILEKIIMVQPYLSSYYEATKYVVDTKNEKIGLIQDSSISKLQKNNSLIHHNNKEVSNSNDDKSSIQDLNTAKEEEFDKKVFRRYKIL